MVVQVRPEGPGEVRPLGLVSMVRPGLAGTGERGTEKAGREGGGGGALVAPHAGPRGNAGRSAALPDTAVPSPLLGHWRADVSGQRL